MNPEMMGLTDRDREMMGLQKNSPERNSKPETQKSGFKKFFGQVRTAVLLGSMASSVFAPEGLRAQGLEQGQTVTRENKKEGEPKYVTEDQIWDSVEHGENEQSYVSTVVNGERRFIFYKDFGKTGGSYNFAEASKLAQSSSTVDMIHTHPKTIYKEVNASADSRINVPLMPSDLDLFSAMKASIQKGRFNIVVYEPSGIWELKADRNHPYVKQYQKFEKGIYDISRKLKSGLSPSDIESVSRVQTDNPDVRTIIDSLKQNPQTLKLGEKMEKAVLEYIAKFPDLTKNRAEELALQTSSRALSGAEPEEINGRIAEYIAEVKKMGIEAKYTKR